MLETLRAAMNWGMAQTPPLFSRSPFHRFDVRVYKKAETARDRRLTRDEEKRLLDAALQKMNTHEHEHVGVLLHAGILGIPVSEQHGKDRRERNLSAANCSE